MNYKTCSKCKQPLPATLEFFVAEKQHKDHLSSCCKNCHNQRCRDSRINNPEKARQQDLDWRKNNKEKCAAAGKKWRSNNPDKMAAKAAKRKAMRLNQTPILTENETKKIDLYYRISQQLGSDWQVDHIQPLIKGGLHHPDNLQVVTATYNLQKGSKLNFRKPTETEYFKL